MQHRRHVGSDATCTLVGSYISLGVGSEALWARLLVSLQYEDTCHVVSPDLPLELGMQLVHGFSLGRA
jgi:hypothetical protein